MKIAPGNPPEVISKALATIVDTADDDDLKYGPNGGFTCIASTPEEDRDGDNLYQEEWKSLPDHITVDSDHGMSVATTVGSGHPYFNSEGNVQTDVSFSSIPRAQEVRTLVKEGHIRNVSVAFMTDKSKKAGEPRRELLNLGIVAVPSNRGAVILDSKALDARAEEIAAEKRSEAEIEPCAESYQSDTEAHTEEIETIETKAPAGTGDGAALTQAIHDASVHLGAMCYPLVPDEDPSGASDGANKSGHFTTLAEDHQITFTTAKGQWIAFDSHEAARAFFADMIKSLDENPELVGVVQCPEEKSPNIDLEALKPEGLTMEQFESALKQILTPESPEEPAPVEETAAASPAEDWARKTQLLKMRVRTRL
jgi:hypothetical protein